MSSQTESIDPLEGIFGDRQVLARLSLKTLEQVLSFRTGDLVRDTPQRKTYAISDRKSGEEFFLKLYFPKNRWSRSFFREGRNELEAFHALSKHGIPVPELLCWGGEKKRGFFLLTRAFVGEELTRVWGNGLPDLWGCGPYQAKIKWLEALFEIVEKLHRQNWVHRDFYLSHVLFGGLEEGRPRLCLVDLQRVTKKSLHRWYVKELAAMNFSCPASISRSDRLRFLLKWLEEKRVTSSVRRWVRSIARKTKKIRSHRPKYG